MKNGRLELLDLPREIILQEILPKLDGVSLAKLNTLSPFSGLTEPAAKVACLKLWKDEPELATRWRNISWKLRLHLENSAVGFQSAHDLRPGVVFDKAQRLDREDQPPDASATCEQEAQHSGEDYICPARISLPGVGPRMLISDVSTAGGRTLRWRMKVQGNAAVEFGVVPEAVRTSVQSLHCQMADPEDQTARAVGVCSNITAGSLLPFRVPVMIGTIIEVVAKRGSLQVLLSNCPGALEMHWLNNRAVHRIYSGPSRLFLEMDFPAHYDVCLAATLWARASIDVLHPVPGLNDHSSVILPRPCQLVSCTCCTYNPGGLTAADALPTPPDMCRNPCPLHPHAPTGAHPSTFATPSTSASPVFLPLTEHTPLAATAVASERAAGLSGTSPAHRATHQVLSEDLKIIYGAQLPDPKRAKRTHDGDVTASERSVATHPNIQHETRHPGKAIHDGGATSSRLAIVLPLHSPGKVPLLTASSSDSEMRTPISSRATVRPLSHRRKLWSRDSSGADRSTPQSAPGRCRQEQYTPPSRSASVVRMPWNPTCPARQGRPRSATAAEAAFLEFLKQSYRGAQGLSPPLSPKPSARLINPVCPPSPNPRLRWRMRHCNSSLP